MTGPSPSDQPPSTVIDHMVAIRHLIDHYYGPAEYDREADIAIAVLADLLEVDEAGRAT